MSSTYSSITVAKKLIEKSNSENGSLTPMQLIKLTYLSHGWMLGFEGRPLLSEQVEAWKYGPVLPDLYKVIKHFRSSPVDIVSLKAGDSSIADDEKAMHAINEVYRVYGHLDGISLSTLTHKKDTPWDKVWTQNGSWSSISNDIIESHFKRLLAA